MQIYERLIRPLFFSKRFYWCFSLLIALFIFAYASALLFAIARILTLMFVLLVVIDYLVLFIPSAAITAVRRVPERLSNGDENPIGIDLSNHYSFAVRLRIIDELPVQFQRRDFLERAFLAAGEEKSVRYSLRPVARGEYHFFDINLFASTPLRLVIRRYKVPAQHKVKVYPSYLNMKRFDLVAYSNNLTELGSRKIRKIGQSVEFEQIREYVNGDDLRTLNWKATARKGGQLMVNNYTDERSQQVYCVIDKGRVMKMPFDGMTLLDYAINATLMLSRVALLKRDRAGLITFGDNAGQIIAADRKAAQMSSILETLYDQKTLFGETDFERLHTLIRLRIPQRSLLVLFTNFESLTGLERQLPYIRAMAARHLVLVVFFENTAIRELTGSPASDIETLYMRTIAEKFADEKKLMVRELQRHGILTMLTPPESLTVNTVNKYLELKARQAI